MRYKNKLNGLYRQLSGGNQKLVGVSNFKWFNKSFVEGIYRTSIIGTYIHYTFFLRVSDLKNIDAVVKQLVIRTKKLGAFSVDICDLNTINYIDTTLLKSKYWVNSYQRILKTYSSKLGS